MQKLRLILIALLISFLSGCDDFPKITPKERCVVVIMENPEESHCRCHMYAWTEEKIGRISESTNYDLMKCNKLIGFNADDSLAIYTWQESIRLWLIRKKR